MKTKEMPKEMPAVVLGVVIIASIAFLLLGLFLGASLEKERIDRENGICYKENLAGLLWLNCVMSDPNTTVITPEMSRACIRVTERTILENDNVSVKIQVTL